MTTQTAIAIQPAPAELLKYTHAALDDITARDLAADVARIESHGHTVTSAIGPRSAVPNNYGASAHRMHAPCWVYDAETRTVRAAQARLETRPHGRTIPPVFTVADSDARIPGYRCFKRDHDANESTHRPQ